MIAPRRFIRLLAAALSSALAPSAAHAANLKDGGFESPVVNAGGYADFVTGQTFSKWTVIGVQGDVAVVSGKFTQNGIAFPAKAGNQWLDLTGYLSDKATGVQQTVKTTVGQQYQLKFSVGNVVDPNNVFGTSSTVDVFVDGVHLLAATNSAGNATTMTWQNFRLRFTAASTTTTVAFINGDPAGDNLNGLDAVSMTPLP
jgi:hypothetical protein